MSPYDLFTNEEISKMNLSNKLNDTKTKTIKKEWKYKMDNFDFKKMVKDLGKQQIDSHEKRISNKAKEQARQLGNLKEEITNQVADILNDKDE
jgi:hypothetical protein